MGSVKGDLRGWWSRFAASMPGSRSSGPPAARGGGVPVGAAASLNPSSARRILTARSHHKGDCMPPARHGVRSPTPGVHWTTNGGPVAGGKCTLLPLEGAHAKAMRQKISKSGPARAVRPSGLGKARGFDGDMQRGGSPPSSAEHSSTCSRTETTPAQPEGLELPLICLAFEPATETELRISGGRSPLRIGIGHCSRPSGLCGKHIRPGGQRVR